MAPTQQKHTILFLAANPSGTDRLALDREARAIQHELERAGYRDSFELETRWAVEPLDLLRELRRLKPAVLHFSGHGGPRPGARGAAQNGAAPKRDSEPRRDIDGGVVSTSGDSGSDGGGNDAAPADLPDLGLYFQGPDGRAQHVSTAALEATLGAAGSSVRVVVLSACYTEPQAKALLAHVDCVVGMSGAILDKAARAFAVGFYGGLGERESVEAAHKQGCAAISLEVDAGSDRPQLKVRAGVDAAKLVLAAPH